MMIWILCTALLLPYGLLMWFFHRAWKQVPVFCIPPGTRPSARITVIVAARNEEENIALCLDSLLGQDYPAELYEIIVVDDQSTDNTSVILNRYKDERLRTLAVPPGENGGKKAALSLGVSVAGGDLIIATDADCKHPRAWIRTMEAFFQKERPVFIAAPVLVRTDHSPVGIFQCLDFMSLQGITAASVHRGFLQMSNGANLAFTPGAYHAVGGYSGIDHLASGDDMLLMQKIADQFPGRTRYCLSPDTIVVTKPAGSLRDFLRQRIRWASKARSYSDKRMVRVLMLVYFVNLSLLIAGIQAIMHPEWLPAWLILLVAKTVFEAIFLWPVADFFGASRMMAWFFPSQPFHILYTIVAGFFGQVKTYRWKGREWN